MGLDLVQLEKNMMERKQMKITRYKEYFKMREDVFAEQYINEVGEQAYRPVKRPLTDNDIIAHLAGDKTFGGYLIVPPDRAYVTVIDIDLLDNNILQAILNAVEEVGITTKQRLCVYSGKKGYHVWFFYDESILAEKAKALGEIIKSRSGIRAEDLNKIEIFPKQSTVGGSGYGNLIKLPFGIHQVTQQRSSIITEDFQRDDEWHSYLEDTNKISSKKVNDIVDKFKQKKDKIQIASQKQNISESGGCSDMLPCFRKILQEGVEEGQRNNIGLRLANYLKRKLPSDSVEVVLQGWNQKNRPPLNNNELVKIWEFALEAEDMGLGCKKNFMRPYCENDCPVKQKYLIAEGDEGDQEEEDDDEPMEIQAFAYDLIPDGFLREYVDFVRPLSEAPVQFHIACGLILIAAVCKRNISFQFGACAIYPNLYLLIIGKSGISRKSTALSPAIKLLRSIDPDVFIGHLMSLESLYKALSESSHKLGIYNEFRSLIENTKKTYGEGLISVLTELWDCPSFLKINLKKVASDESYIDEPSFSILAATTIDWLQVKEGDILGGFMGRFLPIMANTNREKLIAIPPKMCAEKFDHLKGRLDAISKQVGFFEITKGGEEIITKIYAEIMKELDNLPNKEIFESYWSRIEPHILKLAMIFKISENPPKRIIDEKAIMQAYETMKQVTVYYKHLIGKVSFTEDMRLENKVKEALQQVKDKGMQHSLLLKRVNTTADKFGKIISTLKEKDIVVNRAAKTKTKKKQIYWLKKYLPKRGSSF